VACLATVASGLALFVILGALAPVELGQAPFMIGAAAIAWAVGYLSLLTPSGLGVREAALAAILAQALPLPAAVAGSLIYRIALTLGELVAAGAALLAGQLSAEPEGAPPV
jgi:glycosyltransferase 2 family protein